MRLVKIPLGRRLRRSLVWMDFLSYGTTAANQLSHGCRIFKHLQRSESNDLPFKFLVIVGALG